MGQTACCEKNDYVDFDHTQQRLSFDIPNVTPHQFATVVMEPTIDVLKQKMYIDTYQDSSPTEFIKTGIYNHGLLDTICFAFDHHLPIVFTPDVIWTTIMQAVNIHLKQTKNLLVQEQKSVVIKQDGFVRDPPTDKTYRISLNWSQMNESTRRILRNIQSDEEMKITNKWVTVFPELTTKIQNQNPMLYALMVNDFGTTDVGSKIASCISMADTLQQRFNVEIKTRCGIPRFTLEGTIEDWKKLMKKYQSLLTLNKKNKLGMDFWFKHLTPVIKQFKLARKGRIDLHFWRNMYAQTQQLNGPVRIHGWILTFFPYLHTVNKREYVVNTKLFWQRVEFGVDSCTFPNGLTSVPFIWDHRGKAYNMHLVGGLIGTVVDKETQGAKPGFGWAVIDN
jgi:hypothetical protein